MQRTDYCGRIDRRFLGRTVILAGWVHRRRDHGGVIFVDLRDREGLVQVVFDPTGRERSRSPRSCATNSSCASRAWCGRVRRHVNANLVSGEVEVLAQDDRDPERRR